jgi:hypothetical protein
MTGTAAPQAVEFLHIINFFNNTYVDINMYNYILIPSLGFQAIWSCIESAADEFVMVSSSHA